MPIREYITADINREHYYNLNYPKTDRWMVLILWLHLVVFALALFLIYFLEPAAYYPSPFSWRILTFAEAVWALGLAVAATLLPTLLLNRLRNHYLYRLLITACLFVYSYIIVFASGGSIEGHFHFFVIFLLITFYYDWRLGWLGLVLVASHHGILNYIEPHWVYFYGRNDVSVISHALPVLLLVIVTTWICREGRISVALAAKTNEELERKLREKIPGLSETA